MPLLRYEACFVRACATAPLCCAALSHMPRYATTILNMAHILRLFEYTSYFLSARGCYDALCAMMLRARGRARACRDPSPPPRRVTTHAYFAVAIDYFSCYSSDVYARSRAPLMRRHAVSPDARYLSIKMSARGQRAGCVVAMPCDMRQRSEPGAFI